MATTFPEVLGADISKLLIHKDVQTRKEAGRELEQRVRKALLEPVRGSTEVQEILDTLKKDYIESTSGHYKKGGLIGFAAVAIGLEGEIHKYLGQLIISVHYLFKDEDPRVRYYACESLYNICKVAGKAVLEHWCLIFDGVCHLYADVDNEVKNAVQHLDRELKDIVSGAESLRIQEFVRLLVGRMQAKNPCIRQLVLAWNTLLLKDHVVYMVQYLPQYLESLLSMLGDQSRDIKHNADACLNELLKGVKAKPQAERSKIISETAGIVVERCFCMDSACIRLTALCWLDEFIHLTPHEGSSELQQKWVEMLPKLLGATLRCIGDQEEEIRRMAVEMNNSLLDMVPTLEGDLPVDQALDQLLESLQPLQQKEFLQQRQSMDVRTVCLQWICMLLERSREKMLTRATLDRLFDPIFKTLEHENDEVVAATLCVLAQIMEGRNREEEDALDPEGRDLFAVVTHKLLKLFKTRRAMLETRGRLMIRHLCGHLNARRLYVTVARAIPQESDDAEFAKQLVQTFNWILLTAAETKSLREELIETAPLADFGGGAKSAPQNAPPDGKSLFLELLEPWFFNPVSALSLCLWSQQYELATELTARFAAFEPTLDLLKQLDQLVHLLESPVFSRLRLRLLEPQRHPALLKCLLGLAMLLPQAGAFNILRERIHVVQSGLLLESQQVKMEQMNNESKSGHNDGLLSWGWKTSGSSSGAGAKPVEADIASRLLDRFDAVTALSQP